MDFYMITMCTCNGFLKFKKYFMCVKTGNLHLRALLQWLSIISFLNPYIHATLLPILYNETRSLVKWLPYLKRPSLWNCKSVWTEIIKKALESRDVAVFCNAFILILMWETEFFYLWRLFPHLKAEKMRNSGSESCCTMRKIMPLISACHHFWSPDKWPWPLMWSSIRSYCGVQVKLFTVKVCD